MLNRLKTVGWTEIAAAVVLGGIAGVAAASGLLRGVMLLAVYAVISLLLLWSVGLFRNIEPFMRRAMVWFMLAKMAMAILSLLFTSLVFAGVADALGYSREGATIAAAMRDGLPYTHSAVPGDGGVDLVVAHFYSLATTNIWLGFFLFTWASVIGVLLIWLGVSKAWPAKQRRRFGLALMFLPSLLYWTSPISKESIVILGIGIFLAGIAMVFDGRHVIWGLGIAAIGGLVSLLVRPDATLLLVGSAIVALLLPWARRVAKPAFHVRILILGILIVAMVPVIAANRHLLHLNNGQAFVQGALTITAKESSIGGGSAFTTATPTSISQVPYAIVSVLFRPFPWEVRSLLELTASAEGVFLAVWLIRVLLKWRRGVLRPRMDGMMIMSLVFLFAFCIAFSSLGNFGLLVRERVQALPFLLIVLNSFEETGTEAGNPDRDLLTAVVQ